MNAKSEELENIDDAINEDEPESIVHYDITSYGADFDADGLVRRLQRNEIFSPPFQRNFIWKIDEASCFIESLLLGLPVPGIFLAKEQGSSKMLIIDGQQRLLSLRYFFEGIFDNKKEFKLVNVQPQFTGKTYQTLDEDDRINLNNYIIHATVVKQDLPSNDDTSIYHVYQRLNSGGRKLMPQEIRMAVFHGDLLTRVNELNQYANWRTIYGKESERMKDEELILRFFAILDGYESYRPSMTQFINLFCKKYRNNHPEKITYYSDLFKQCCDIFSEIANRKPFRLSEKLNVSFFEAAMTGLAIALSKGKKPTITEIQAIYDALIANADFKNNISHSVGNPTALKTRIDLAVAAFA